jgi:hypothetical protein
VHRTSPVLSLVTSVIVGIWGCGHAPSEPQPRTVGLDSEALPLADPETERRASSMHRSGFSPEEFAARFAHVMVNFSYDRYRYRQPGLTDWVRRLGDIVFQRNGAPPLPELRRRFLTPDEIRVIELR